MNEILQTASGLSRDERCPPNRVLPQVQTNNPDALRGRAGHRFLELVGGGMSPTLALAEVPEEYQAMCADIDLEGLPLDLGEYLQEVAFAFSLDTGEARELGRGLERDYSQVRPGEIAGTADVVHRDCVEVYDYKFDSFEPTCPPPGNNPQLLFLALAAARLRGVDRARVTIIHIRPDGTHWEESDDLDAFDLDAFELRLRAIRAGVVAAQAIVARGLIPSVEQGPWCRYCPATAHCPAIAALLRAAAGEPEEVLALRGVVRADDPEAVHMLTRELARHPEHAAKAYQRMRQVENALKVAKTALYLYASEQPIALDDGQVYGPVRTERKEWDGRKTRGAMLELHGPEVAEAACDYETSATAVARALRPIYEARKKGYEAALEAFKAGGKVGEKPARVTMKALTVAAEEAVREAGGISLKSSVSVKEHRAGKEGEVLAPVQAEPALPSHEEAAAPAA